jgi:hypothetical protein
MPDDSSSNIYGSVGADDSAIATQGLATDVVAEINPPIRFSLRSMLIAMAVAAGLAYLGASAYRQSIKAAQVRRDQNLKESIHNCMGILAQTLSFYGGTESSFPYAPLKNKPWPPTVPKDSTGKPLHSWRLQLCNYILCMCEETPQVELSAPWNTQTNLAYAEEMAGPFCPGSGKSDRTARLFGITGPGSAFDETIISEYSELPGDVIVVMDVADAKIHCMQPGDYEVDKLLAATGRLGDTVKSLLPDRIHVLFADGEVWALSPDTPIDAVKPFFTITGAKAASRD